MYLVLCTTMVLVFQPQNVMLQDVSPPPHWDFDTRNCYTENGDITACPPNWFDNDIPGEGSDEVPEEVPKEEVPDEVPGEIPGEASDEVPDKVPDEVHDEVPDETPDKVPDEVHDNVPVETPEEVLDFINDGETCLDDKPDLDIGPDTVIDYDDGTPWFMNEGRKYWCGQGVTDNDISSGRKRICIKRFFTIRSKRKLAWDDIWAGCREHGLDPISIENVKKLFWVKELLVSAMLVYKREGLWTSGHKNKTTGQWMWGNGCPLVKSTAIWAIGEPNNYKNRGENCMEMYSLPDRDALAARPRYNDDPCGRKKGYLCEEHLCLDQIPKYRPPDVDPFYTVPQFD